MQLPKMPDLLQSQLHESQKGKTFCMTYDLSAEEIGILTGWYQAAAGEGCGADTVEDFALLDKLRIQAHSMDLWFPAENDWTESSRSEVRARIAAIAAYRKRHPEMELVKQIEKEQPCPTT